MIDCSGRPADAVGDRASNALRRISTNERPSSGERGLLRCSCYVPDVVRMLGTTSVSVMVGNSGPGVGEAHDCKPQEIRVTIESAVLTPEASEPPGCQ